MTLGELVGQTARRLAAARLHYGHGTDNPRDEAAFLVRRGLGLAFDTSPERRITTSQHQKVEALLRKRIRDRIPVAYLLREAWLDGLAFYVDPRVIVPRSHIAGLLRQRLRPWLRRPARRILDLCTGSGCLAILAARAFPAARIDAADICAAALAVAKRNLRKYALESRISLIRSDLFDALENKRYDLIVTNPPYVTTPSMSRLPPEYRHEPAIALAGGRIGLDQVQRIVKAAPAHLEPGGLLVCETGDNRRALERAYRRMPFLWPQDEVFILEASRTPGFSRTRPRPARARG